MPIELGLDGPCDLGRLAHSRHPGMRRCGITSSGRGHTGMLLALRPRGHLTGVAAEDAERRRSDFER